MDTKNPNEELQSRREFFKKAAKAALPVVGAVVFSQMPALGQITGGKVFFDAQRSDCQDCTGSCMGGCQSSCRNTCEGNCTGDCTGSSTNGSSNGQVTGCVVGGGCMNSCAGGCKGTCYRTCYTGCDGYNY